MACPGALQAIPSPALAKFVGDGDDDSARAADLYDIATWRRLRMSVFRRDPDDPVWVDVDDEAPGRHARHLAGPRRRARAAPPDLHLRHGAARRRSPIVVRKGRAYVPGEGRLAGIPPAAIGDGDGALTIEQASAWTGAEPEIVRIAVSRHRDTVRTPVAFAAILKALA